MRLSLFGNVKKRILVVGLAFCFLFGICLFGKWDVFAAGTNLSTAEEIVLGQTVRGQTPSSNTERIYFKLDLPTNMLVKVKIKGTVVGNRNCFWLYFLDESGNEMDYQCIQDTNNWGYPSREFYISLKKGISYIDLSSSGQSYEITVTEVVRSGKNVCIGGAGKIYLATAAQLDIGQTIYDTLSGDSWCYHYYKFTVNKDQTVRFGTELPAQGTDFFDLDLLDQNGNIIKDFDYLTNNGLEKPQYQSCYLKKGTYFLKTSGSKSFAGSPQRYKIYTEGIIAGWTKNNKGWRYRYSDGSTPDKGWRQISGKWYYFLSDGYIKTGWIASGKDWYYLDPTSGFMTTGWKKIGGAWYYFGTNGVMANTWRLIGGKWYYFKNGILQTGWLKIGKNWYFFKADGTMKTGWLKSGSKWYYFDSEGVMVTGTKVIKNKTYRFNSNGVCLNP